MSEHMAGDVPAELQRAMNAAIAAGASSGANAPDAAPAAKTADAADAADAANAETIARAALDRLRAALQLGDDRAAAYELLTADALLTEASAAAIIDGRTTPSLDAAAFVALLEDA